MRHSFTLCMALLAGKDTAAHRTFTTRGKGASEVSLTLLWHRHVAAWCQAGTQSVRAALLKQGAAKLVGVGRDHSPRPKPCLIQVGVHAHCAL